MSDSIIEARGLAKVFVRGILSSGPRRVRAFSDVDIAIPRGSVFGLVGESGSGKSSLARVLVGIDAPSSGSVLYEGRGLDLLRGEVRRSTRRRLQMVFQDPRGALDPRMSVGASIGEALISAGTERRLIPDAIEGLLRSVRIDPGFAPRRPHELSGGQRQRVVIARALACSPVFIALDEPVSSLDVSVQAAILELLMEIKESRGLTYLLVSHDLALVAAVCDELAVMKGGRLVELGKARSVMEAPNHAYTRELRDKSLEMGSRRHKDITMRRTR